MKASKIEIENSVIRVLENGPWSVNRKFDTDAAAYAEYTGQLVEDIHDECLTAQALHAGMVIFRKQWTFQRWPVTGELLAYLKQGAAATQPRIAHQEQGEKHDPDKWARQIMHSETGKRALAQGWYFELHDWAKRNPGKTPQDEDVRQMIEGEKTGRERIAQVRRDHGRMFAGQSLLKMAEGFEKKKAELLAEYGRNARAA